MAIDITGRHIEIPSRDKDWVRERAARLERHIGKITEGRLILTGEKRRVTAEAMITARRRTWEAHAEGADLPGALAEVFDRLETQAKKERARQKDHKGKKSARTLAEGFAPAPHSDGAIPERRIVKTAPTRIKPMSAEEAALELDDSLREFIVFHDASSERVSVMYKRKDGHFGLIAPEW